LRAERRHANRLFRSISDGFVIIVPEVLLRGSQARQSTF